MSSPRSANFPTKGDFREGQEQQRQDDQTPLRNGWDDIVEAIIFVLVANLRLVARRSACKAAALWIAGLGAVAEQPVVADGRVARTAAARRIACFDAVASVSVVALQ